MDANMLSAKIIKAEMLGDMDRVAELKNQLEQLESESRSVPTGSWKNNGNRPGDNHHRQQQRSKNPNRGDADELNRLNAKIIKAEMMGDSDRVEELKSQLKSAQNQMSTSSSSSRQSQPVLSSSSENLNKINAQLIKAEMLGDAKRVAELRKMINEQNVDRPIEGPLMGPTLEPQRNAKLNQLARKISDDRLGLKQMFVSAKRGEVEDEAKLFIASSSKLINMDDEYEDVVRRGKKKRREEVEERPRIVTQPDDQECGFCIQKMRKHLIVSVKSSVYLCLPHHEPFVDGHCFIRSVNHVPCSVEAEENCLAEILEMRQKLCSMVGDQKKNVVFTEMYLKRGHNKHFQIECFPIKQKYMADCKMYFKKAIMECEMEWSMNKKLVEIKDKCITKSLPKGLSYFWVSFGSSNDSYGHVIEEEKYFPKHFAYEVIAGLIDIDRFKYTKPRSEAFNDQFERVSKFKTIWKQFDTNSNEHSASTDDNSIQGNSDA